MVNKTQFYKTKVALAVVVSLGLTACGGGDDSTANSNANTVTEAVDNTIEQVSGTGSVQGTVLDTNGLPVMDATVSLAGQSVMTDASGYYHFVGVPLPGVDGVNDGGSNNNGNAAYTVTITGPEGYASATVSVQAEDIQVDSGNNGNNASSGETNAAGEQTTWFDGFLAQADTANLPKFAASVTGVLRDCNTGAPLPAGIKVALDYQRLADPDTSTGTGASLANDVTVGVPVFTTTTGAEGVFTFDNLPTDSEFSLLVEGYSDDGGNDSVEDSHDLEDVLTTGEGIVNNLGTTNMCLITSSDTIKPHVSNVSGWIQDSVDNYGILNEGIDTVFTIHFNEPLDADAFNVADVLVTNDDSEILATVADGVVLSADGTSVTVTLAEAQSEGTKISIFIPWQDTTDVAGNFLSVTANDGDDIDFDSQVNASSGKASFLRVNLCVFLKAIINPTGFTAAQNYDQDDAADASDAELFAYSNAFWDDKEGDAELRQLNGQANTALALDLLAEEVSSAAANSFTVDVNHAWVEIDLGEAASYDVDVGPLVAQTAEDLWFDGVEHGDVIEFTYNNDLGLASGTVEVTLVDGVKPTTTLQENYTLPGTTGYTDLLVTTGSVPTQGAGGEVTEVGVDATTGNPIIYVQPRHLTPTLANNTADTAEGAEFAALVDGVAARSGTATETPEAFTDTVGGTAHPIYDDAAFTAWTAEDRENSMGVAFTENIALTASADPIFSGTDVTLNNYSALNNVDSNIDGLAHANGLSSEDLVRLEVSDMVALANDNHNTTLAFSGDVEDTQGNIADDNSQATVVFRDAMPPMVTSAIYTGTTLEITFNEDLGSRADLDDTDIVIDDLDTTADAAAVTLNLESSVTTTAAATDVAFTISTDLRTLTVELGSEAASVNPLFEDGANDEFLWEDNSNNVQLEQHASLAWDEIPDANGNAWASFDVDTVAGTPRYEVQAPRFYAYNDVGAFTVTYAYAGLVAGAGPDTGGFSASITFSHPLDFGDNNPAAKTVFVEKADGDDNDVFFENVADIQRLLVLDINGDGIFDSATETFPAGTTAAWINTGGTTRLDLVVPTGLSIVYGTSELVFGSVNNIVTDVTDIADTNPIVLGDAISSLTGQSRTVSDIVNN